MVAPTVSHAALRHQRHNNTCSLALGHSRRRSIFLTRSAWFFEQIIINSYFLQKGISNTTSPRPPVSHTQRQLTCCSRPGHPSCQETEVIPCVRDPQSQESSSGSADTSLLRDNKTLCCRHGREHLLIINIEEYDRQRRHAQPHEGHQRQTSRCRRQRVQGCAEGPSQST